jgi:hypothetical protein
MAQELAVLRGPFVRTIAARCTVGDHPGETLERLCVYGAAPVLGGIGLPNASRNAQHVGFRAIRVDRQRDGHEPDNMLDRSTAPIDTRWLSRYLHNRVPCLPC